MTTLRLAVWLTVLSFLATLSSGQSVETRSTLYGRALDPQGAAIPGATVTVTNAETNVAVKLTTNGVGY